ncbi:hypothetical protein PO002_44470 [Cupriavidus necator]|uniref:hypothetical protein n=1 Tax=Cupriavidus necator TaxID=106590 RepID=UPI0039C360BE
MQCSRAIGCKPAISCADLTQPLPALELQAEDRLYGEPRLGHQLLADEGPAITGPVTSQKRVRISHDGRRIVLGFDCGFLEAMVLNRVLVTERER